MTESLKFKIYNALIDAVSSDSLVMATSSSSYWSICEAEHNVGIAMTTQGGGTAQMFPDGIEGLQLCEAARAVKSWRLEEASFGMAAINAHMNTVEHMNALRCAEPFENYCTQGLDFTDKTIGLIGHLHMPEYIRSSARDIFTIERAPQNGDYPDAACDFILPQCDYVLITGSALVNKTLPHLLELCENAYTILVGPTVPMCPALLDFGIDRLAGMVIQKHEALTKLVQEGKPFSPYPFGQSWLLKK